MRFSARRRAAALIPAVLLVAVAGCTPGDDPGPSPTPTVTATATGTGEVPTSPTTTDPGAADPTQVAATVAAAAALGEPARSAQGTILSLSLTQEPAELGVFRVEAGTTSTRLVIGLRTPGDEVSVSAPALSIETWDIAEVSLIDPVSESILKPFASRRPEAPAQTESFCACSDYPKTIGATWHPLYALVPALDAATTTVTVRVPGFPDVTDVPVTRG